MVASLCACMGFVNPKLVRRKLRKHKIAKAGRFYDFKSEKGIEEVYQAILGTGLKAEAFEGAQYNRIAHVRSMINKGLIGTDLRWKATETIEAAE